MVSVLVFPIVFFLSVLFSWPSATVALCALQTAQRYQYTASLLTNTVDFLSLFVPYSFFSFFSLSLSSIQVSLSDKHYGHKMPVIGLVNLPGKVFASASLDGSIWIWKGIPQYFIFMPHISVNMTP
jgi:hypothetical protein